MFRGKNLLLVLMIVALSIFNTNLAVWAEANDFSVQATFNMTALVPGKVLSVKANATNTSPVPYTGTKDVLIILAIYDDNNSMVGYNCFTKPVPYQGTVQLSGGLLIPTYVTVTKARTFMWDGTLIETSNMIPYSNVVEIPGSQI